jgi:hypothetical protein
MAEYKNLEGNFDRLFFVIGRIKTFQDSTLSRPHGEGSTC